MTDWTTLVSAQDLAAQLGREDLIVIDARSGLGDPEAGPAAYAQAHIPGARYAHLDRDLSDHRKRNAGRHPWPDGADFTATLERWGVSPDDQVVAYDHGDGALAAARLWALLRLLGHRRVAVLDGGWQRWTALGLPTDAMVPTPQPSRYPGNFDQHRLLDADAVRAHLDAGGLLIDARAAERFRGDVEPLDRVAGHVPGARNRPYAQNLQDGGFKPAGELAQGFAAVMGEQAPQQTVVMCGSGVTACHHLLAMEHAGLPGAGLFTGSWSGWIDDPSRPIATGEA
ncbi:sulfurtransferase [Lysobacter sp. Root916]|uniref:sulfurtransferase n=1 Tax=Lysobacter sp. Root916 TaxID=1736606 RepID=UPI00070E7596|nr:sulfurtransferase [Lysobacter sp. Root916]KRD30576.1 sulfurtransferase [Lysobacter sp. Root916]